MKTYSIIVHYNAFDVYNITEAEAEEHELDLGNEDEILDFLTEENWPMLAQDGEISEIIVTENS